MKTLDTLCQDALTQFQAPGLSIVIVKDDRIVYLKGFGVRKLGSRDAVTPDTLFPLASCTKPFTSLAVAAVVDDGKLHWDDPVRKHVPIFRLSDPLADANVTLRDLLCHRTGLGTHDLLWYGNTWPQEERIRRAGLLPLRYSFRSHFHYQSVLFGAAGLAAGNAAKSSWKELVESRIFTPLEMKSSFAVAPSPGKYVDQASPHRRGAKGDIEVVERYPLDRPDPAGSIHSTARDLAKFLRLQLGDGSWEGRRVVSTENLHETQAPHMVVRREGFIRLMNPATLQISYGLGWINQDYHGKLLVLHGGAIDGFRAQLTLVPQEGLGIAVLSNLDRGYMNLALTQSILDVLWKQPARDWNGYYVQVQKTDEAQNKARHEAFMAESKPQAGNSLPLFAFAGNYEDPAYGPVRVVVENGRLVWQMHAYRWLLESYARNTFYTSNRLLGDALFEFELDQGDVKSVRCMNRTFHRQPDRKMP